MPFAHPRSSPFHSQILPFIHSARAEIANLTLMPCSPLALLEPSLNQLCCSLHLFLLSACLPDNPHFSLNPYLAFSVFLYLLLDIWVGTRQVQKAFIAFTVVIMCFIRFDFSTFICHYLVYATTVLCYAYWYLLFTLNEVLKFFFFNWISLKLNISRELSLSQFKSDSDNTRAMQLQKILLDTWYHW